MTALWFLLGAGAGGLQAFSLGHAARAVWSFPLRYAGVALVLVSGALLGHVLAAALGWALGFFGGAALVAGKLR